MDYYTKINENVFSPELIIVLGCGGIGTKIAPQVTAFIRQNKLVNCSLLFVDSDLVESRNRGNQEYFPYDIGLPKAYILEQRHGQNVKTLPAIIEEVNADTIDKIFTDEILSKTLVVLDCMDHQIPSTQVLNKLLSSSLAQNFLWIYAGGDWTEKQGIAYPYVSVYSYAKVGGTPISILEDPRDIDPSLFRATGYSNYPQGGGGCGVEETPFVRQTASMNIKCMDGMMDILSMFFVHGILETMYVFKNGVGKFYPEDKHLVVKEVISEESSLVEGLLEGQESTETETDLETFFDENTQEED